MLPGSVSVLPGYVSALPGSELECVVGIELQ